jgi:hypothetical protein
VLDQHTPPGAPRLRIREQLADHIELMEAREELIPLDLACFRVLALDDLGVVLDDVRQAERREDVLPEIIGLQPGRVWRIAGPIVKTLVERQEPGGLALELGAELHLRIIDREVNHAAAGLEQFFSAVAVALVLLDGILDRLLRQAVLEFERGDRQAVDEQRKIERVGGVVAAVAKLAGDREPVQREAPGGLGVAGRRGAMKQVHVVRTVLDPVAQNLDDAALAGLALQPGQEFLAGRALS